MATFTRILLGLCLFLLQDSCASAAVLDFTSQLSNDPLFTKVIERLNNLENENEVQRQEIKNLEATNAFQQEMIQTLEQNVEHLNQEIEQMKTSATGETNKDIEPSVDGSAQTKDIESSVDGSAQTKDIETSVDGSAQTKDIETSVGGSAQTNDEVNVQDKVNEVNAANRIRRQRAEIGNVAFTVILTNQLTNLGLNQNILFNTIETNIGNAYNPHQGVFVAPLSGTYVFHITIFTLRSQEAWCKIVVNGKNKVDAYAHGDTAHQDTGTQTLVVHLNQGDDVAIQNGRAGNDVYGDDDMLTTFSGYLLRSDAELASLNAIG